MVDARLSIHWIHIMIKTKDAGLRVRVERDLREEFVAICQADGKPAAQVLREFMRQYVDHNRRSGDLFGKGSGLLESG